MARLLTPCFTADFTQNLNPCLTVERDVRGRSASIFPGIPCSGDIAPHNDRAVNCQYLVFLARRRELYNEGEAQRLDVKIQTV